MTTDICPECDTQVEVERGRFVKHEPCPGWFLQVNWTGDPKSEGRFTVARDDCPHPERWHSDDADSTEHEVTDLVAAFVRALRASHVLETGSAWGQTAEAIGRALRGPLDAPEHDYRVSFTTIEPSPERAAHTRWRCEGLPVHVAEMTSMEFVPDERDGPIDFAWFDSLHQLRVPEFHYFYPYMSNRTIVGFHDSGPHQGTLRQEIEQLETEGYLFPMHLSTPRGVTFGQVLKL